jgi:hypothetical protein
MLKPIALQSEYLPPTQSQNSKIFSSAIPNAVWDVAHALMFVQPVPVLIFRKMPKVRPVIVSLGDGGQITLRFTNNSLTGSGSSALDLWIFEVGPDVEDTFVDISKDGANWFSVGKVAGATAGIDIDAYGFGTSDFFSYVRLTDDTDEGEQGNGQTVGADIDAVGAISSAPPVNQVPEPTTLALLGIALAIAGMRGRPASR